MRRHVLTSACVMIMAGPLIFAAVFAASGCSTARPRQITIKPAAGQFLYLDAQQSAGVKLVDIRAEQAVTDKDYIDLQAGIVRKGQPCLVVTGTAQSQLTGDWYMTLYAVGYDKGGNEVSHTLDAGPIVGVISLYLPPGDQVEFQLHLTAAPNTVAVELKPSPDPYDMPPP